MADRIALFFFRSPLIDLDPSAAPMEKNMHTVGFLIESGTAVRWHCVICEKSGEADLLAIQAARGPDYDLTDRTPWCQKTGCLGRVWFSVRIGSWMRKLLTVEGEARLEAHGDWVFVERQRLKRARAE